MADMEIKKILSINIKKLRKAYSLSQFELAEKADVSDQTINSIEGCRLWPSDKTLKKIAEALNVEVYKLFIPTEIDISSEIKNDLKITVKNSMEKILGSILNEL